MEFINENYKNDNELYNITCFYNFYSPIDNNKIIFKDENILINLTNSNLEGFGYMINEINNKEYQNADIEEFEEEIMKFQDVINIHQNTAEFIVQLSNGFYISGGNEKRMVIYDNNFKKIIETNELEDVPYNVIEKKTNNKNIIEIIVCCAKYISLIIFNKNNNNCNIKKFDIPNFFSFSCCEIENNNYIFSGEKGIINFVNFFNNQNIITNEITRENTYRNGIKINDNTFAFTSNSIIPNGQDKLIFVNFNSKKISNEIKGYSFIYSSNGLNLFSSDKGGVKFNILFCACKKYYSEQKNGILIVDLQLENNQEIEHSFHDTDNFEVFCFCQIFNFKNKNLDENRGEIKTKEAEYEKTDFFLVGGFDEEKGEGVIKLYKILYGNKPYFTKIEYIQDIEIEINEKFGGFESAITCILQSTINGNILITCLDGKVYQFSQPDINFYLNEDFI